MLSTMRWVPLVLLSILAVAFEPVRAGLVFENQGCDWSVDQGRLADALFNPRHLISYGLFVLLAAVAFPKARLLAISAAVLIFSALLEVEQSFLATGHCRLRDMVPNVIGIAVAATAIFIVRRLRRAG